MPYRRRRDGYEIYPSHVLPLGISSIWQLYAVNRGLFVFCLLLQIPLSSPWGRCCLFLSPAPLFRQWHFQWVPLTWKGLFMSPIAKSILEKLNIWSGWSVFLMNSCGDSFCPLLPCIAASVWLLIHCCFPSCSASLPPLFLSSHCSLFSSVLQPLSFCHEWLDTRPFALVRFKIMSQWIYALRKFLYFILL